MTDLFRLASFRWVHGAIITFLISVISFQAMAQRAKVDQGVEWFGTSSAVKLHPKFGIYLDGQFRFAKSFDNMQHQFRTAFDFYVNNKLTISPVGYVYIWNYIYGEQPAAVINNEHRIYQQIQYKHTTGRFAFTHRFRTEQRFIQFHSGSSPNFVDEGYSENFQFRLRHRVLVNLPLKGEKVEPKSFYITGFTEFFMSWGKEQYITYTGKLDQFRLFVGPGYQINKSANIQLGPFYQYLVKSKGDKQENNIGSFVQLNYNFDLSKKKEK